jgi:hypothetical protein
MERRFEDIFNRVYPNLKTRENYKVRLNAMMRKVGAKTMLEILVSPEVWYPKIQEAYESLTTRKNILTPLLVLFREDVELAAEHAKARDIWKKRHEDLVRFQEARVRRSEPEDKQIAKYTSFEEIEAEYDSMRKKAPHETRKKSQQFLLLSIILHLRPKRADLGALKIYEEVDPHRTDENYLVLRKAGAGASFIAMNMYKTSKHYQTVEEDLPEGLVRDIRQSLARWPRTYLFEKEEGGPMSNKTYSGYVMRTFEELFGRGTGVSLLRHIYISEKLNFDDMTIEEQDEEARLMLHTSGLQRRYKWPKKVICPKLCAGYEGTRRVPRRHQSTSGTRRSPKGARSRPTSHKRP